jgi:TPR repeat protein
MKLKSLCLLLILLPVSGCDSQKAVEYGPPINDLPGSESYQKALGFMIEKNYPEALPPLEDAAQQNNPEAQYQLGLLFARGDGVAQNYPAAHEWLLRAAMEGHPKAQYYLGQMYSQGDGVEVNPREGFVWFWLAASNGDKDSKYYMKVLQPKITTEDYKNVKKRVHALWKQMPHDNFDVPVEVPVD